MEVRSRNVLGCLINSGALGLGTLALVSLLIYSLWSVLWPWIVLAILIPVLTVSILVTFLSCDYIIKHWKTLETRASTHNTPQIEIVEPALAFDSPPMPKLSLADRTAWNNDYVRFYYLAHCKGGSCSFGKLKPYFPRNARRYWEHMKNYLLSIDACYEDEKYGTLINMPYRKFAMLVREGMIAPSPCSDLSPPGMIIWAQEENIVNTLNIANMVNISTQESK